MSLISRLCFLQELRRRLFIPLASPFLSIKKRINGAAVLHSSLGFGTLKAVRIWSLVFSLTFFLLNVAAVEASKPVVAVFQIQNKAGLSKNAVEQLTDLVAAQLTASGHYQVLPSSEVKKALRQKTAESYEACYDEACQIEIGKEIAAQKTLSTKVSKLDQTCIVTMQLYDLRKSASEKAATKTGKCELSNILELLQASTLSLTLGDQVVKKQKPDQEKIKAEARKKAAARFKTRKVGTQRVVKDTKTGLLWQREYTKKNWKDAVQHCKSLTYAGYSDWRLPNKVEGAGLIDSKAGGSPYTYFPGTPLGFSQAVFWTSTPVWGIPLQAWYVDFSMYLGPLFKLKHHQHFVRCVR